MNNIERDFRKTLKIEQKENPNQYVIVNGQPQPSVMTCMCCPTCGEVIYNLGQKYSEAQVYKLIYSEQLDLSRIKYCPKCGQRVKPIEIIDM